MANFSYQPLSLKEKRKDKPKESAVHFYRRLALEKRDKEKHEKETTQNH